MTSRLDHRRLLLPLLLAGTMLGVLVPQARAAAGEPAQATGGAQTNAPAVAPATNAADDESIVAVVNGDVVTQGDVDARARLFALSASLPLSPDVLSRLDAQISQTLIDERLRLQEAQSRKIVVPDADVAAQIAELNKRNNGDLEKSLAASGISQRTLIAELRAQIAWSQVLRQELGDRARVTPQQLAERMAAEKAAEGKPEYEIAEIFVPISSPLRADAAKRFADTVIGRLRGGAAFANIAAEFSQSDDALTGGDQGWVRPSEMDDAVADVVSQMPVGAVSNPIRVPGGYAIVTLQEKRIAGREMVTMAKVRQAFFPFTSNLVPSAPTDEQKAMLIKARALSTTAHDCAAVDAANTAAGSKRPSDPGDLPLERLSNPALKQILTSLKINQPSQPLISEDGILVMMVCSESRQNLAEVTPEEMANRIVNERVERLDRSLQRQLERQATITRYGVAAEEDDQD